MTNGEFRFNPFRVGGRVDGFFPCVSHTVIHVKALRAWAADRRPLTAD
jgi:hypothetical protein